MRNPYAGRKPPSIPQKSGAQPLRRSKGEQNYPGVTKGNYDVMNGFLNGKGSPYSAAYPGKYRKD